MESERSKRMRGETETESERQRQKQRQTGDRAETKRLKQPHLKLQACQNPVSCSSIASSYFDNICTRYGG